MKNKLNFGVIGVGYWGPNFVRNLIKLQEVGDVEVSDPNEERLKEIKDGFPEVRTNSDYLFTLNNPNIDAVVIASPAGTHFKIAKEALEHGKHFLVEKPLATTSKECSELIKLAKNAGKVLMVGHTFIYNSAVNMLKEYVEKDELGDIYYIYSQRLNLGRLRQDVNTMWNFAPHDISIILYLLGQDPIKVSAQGKSYLQEDIEDVVFMNLEFASEVLTHIHISWLDPQKVRKTTLVGSKKMAVYDDLSPDAKIKIYDKGFTKMPNSDSPSDFDSFGEFQLLQRSGDIFIPNFKFTEPLQNECLHFIDCIKNNKKPLTDGEHGLKVVRILEAAQKSLKNGGVTVSLGMP
jgi:predicted dehydrogenase